MVVENCGGTIRGGFGGRAHDDDRTALLDVRGVKFLVADVIGLGAGIGADYRFQRAAFAEKFREPVMVGRRRIRGFFAGRVDGARVVVGVGDQLHLPAGDSGVFQIFHCIFPLAKPFQNSDHDVFHGELLSL